jgi:hypothetical protein
MDVLDRIEGGVGRGKIIDDGSVRNVKKPPALPAVLTSAAEK